MFSNNLLMAAAGGGGVTGYVIEGSAMSEDANLVRAFETPAVNGQKIWVYSTVRKQSEFGGDSYLLSDDNDSGSPDGLYFDDEVLKFRYAGTGKRASAALFRDAAAYGHLVIAFDSTQGTEADRFRGWWNGVAITFTDVNTIAQNDEPDIGGASNHSLLRNEYDDRDYFNGYTSLVSFQPTVTITDPETDGYGEFDNDGYWQILDISELSYAAVNSFLLEGGVNVAAGVDSNSALTVTLEGPSDAAFADEGSNYSFVGRSVSSDIVNKATRVESAHNFAADFTVAFQPGPATTDGGHLVVGVYDIAEDGTYSVDDQTGAMSSMTASWWCERDGDVKYGSSNKDTGTFGADDTIKLKRSGSTLTWYKNDVLYHEHTDTSSATLRLVIAAGITGITHRSLRWWDSVESEGNFFTPTGTPTATNDSPTNDADNDIGNYATLSPIDKNSNITLSNGNLTIDGGTAQGYPSFGTQSITEGKYYYEFEFDTLDGTNAGPVFGFCNRDANDFSLDLVNVAPADYYTMRYWIGGTGYRVHNDTSIYQPNNDPTAAAGQLGAVAIDLDAGKGWFLIDDVIMADSGGTQGSIASGTNPCFTFTANTPMLPVAGATTDATGICNFGQTTFTNTPPTGFKALSTANMPDPAIPDPTEHHQVELVSHDGSSTNFTCNWDADTYDTLFIIKNRDSVEAFHWIDGVRGYNKYFTSETTDAWTTDSNVITVSGTTITLGSTLANDNYVVECHRAGASASRTAHTADVPPDLASTTSFNSVTGFCIMTWTGGGTLGQTINHGMGQAPDLFISSQDNASQNKRVYHSSIGATKYINLESTNGTATSSNFMNDTEPTASVISLGATGFSNNDSGASHVGYAWYSVEGNSAFGSYEGNASTDGSVVNVGIKPLSAFVKAIDSTDWWQKMETVGGVAFNGDCDALYYNSTYAETDEDANNGIDIISNGLKMRGAGGQINAAETYIYGIWGGRPIQGPAPASNTSQGRAR